MHYNSQILKTAESLIGTTLGPVTIIDHTLTPGGMHIHAETGAKESIYLRIAIEVRGISFETIHVNKGPGHWFDALCGIDEKNQATVGRELRSNVTCESCILLVFAENAEQKHDNTADRPDSLGPRS